MTKSDNQRVGEYRGNDCYAVPICKCASEPSDPLDYDPTTDAIVGC